MQVEELAAELAQLTARTPIAVDVGDQLACGPVSATLWGIADLYAAMG